MKILAKVSVFLVDDDSLYLRMLEQNLSFNKKIRIRSFNSAESCIKKLHWNPDLIVLDFFLDSNNQNRINGLQALMRIKELKPNSNVVMLSSSENVEYLLSCMDNGALDYVVKSGYAAKRVESIARELFLMK